jgi:predicted  nucleic acid-binding Zn-ribbon protein
LDSKIADLEDKKAGQTVSSGLKVSKSGKLHTSSGDPQAKLQQKIDELKLQRSQVSREIEDLEERARKAHALPEWLR